MRTQRWWSPGNAYDAYSTTWLRDSTVLDPTAGRFPPGQHVGVVALPPHEGIWVTPLENLGGVLATAYEERAASVRAAYLDGVALPPAVLEVSRDGIVRLVDGNHRLAVARELGIEAIPVRWVFP